MKLKQLKVRVKPALFASLKTQAREHGIPVSKLVNLLLDDRVVVAVSRKRFHHYMECNNITGRQLKIKDGY